MDALHSLNLDFERQLRRIENILASELPKEAGGSSLRGLAREIHFDILSRLCQNSALLNIQLQAAESSGQGRGLWIRKELSPSQYEQFSRLLSSKAA